MSLAGRALTLFAAALACAALAAPAAAQGAAARASLPDIEDEVMCPICGTLLSLSSSPQAERQRFLIRSLIAEGRNKQQIKDALVAEYGPSVLAIPEQDTGFDLLGWVLPVLGLAGAGVALALALRRWRRTTPGRAAPAAAADPGEQARLDEDLRRYEL